MLYTKFVVQQFCYTTKLLSIAIAEQMPEGAVSREVFFPEWCRTSGLRCLGAYCGSRYSAPSQVIGPRIAWIVRLGSSPAIQ